MGDLSRFKLGHAGMLAYMQSLGYPIEDAGLCRGLATMGMQAILSGDIDSFNKRIAVIDDAPHNPSLDIKAFFDGILLYQSPKDFMHLNANITNMISQDPGLGLSLVQPELLEKKGGASRIAYFSGAYTRDELLTYFKLLRESLCDDSATVAPFALVIANINHAITVGFDPTKKEWIFIDANSLPVQRSPSDEGIAYGVRAMCNKYDATAAKAAVFSATLYSAGNNSAYIREKIAECQRNSQWMQMHAVTPDKAKLIDRNNTSWLMIEKDIKKIDELIRAGANVNQQSDDDSERRSVGYVAARDNNYETMRFLLSHGVNPDVADSRGGTALILAAKNNHLEMVQLLLQHKANPNLASSTASALHFAAQNGNVEMVCALLDAGANSNLQVDGQTALYAAAKKNHLSIATELLKRGADPNIQDQTGVTPLMVAAYFGHTDLFRLLLDKGGDPDLPNENRVTARALVAEQGFEKLAFALCAFEYKKAAKELRDEERGDSEPPSVTPTN